MNWKINLMKKLLDDFVYEYGVDTTIVYLMKIGLGYKQLLELGFHKDILDKIFRRLSKYETEL